MLVLADPDHDGPPRRWWSLVAALSGEVKRRRLRALLFSERCLGGPAWGDRGMRKASSRPGCTGRAEAAARR
jgi:hypothetical protein